MEQREPLVTNIFTADPSAHVFDGKIYVYPSHDIPHDGEDDDDGGEYIMEDYHVLSMDSLDSVCTDNGEALHMKDVPWVGRQMWAPDCACKDGKYYLYFPAKDKNDVFRIGVAVSGSPTGPFTAEPEPIKDSMSIDPAVFRDDDGRYYMYAGGLWGGQLERWQTGVYEHEPDPVDENGPALGPLFAEMSDDMKSFKEKPRMVTILDEYGEPMQAWDDDRRYFEGPWMHKYNGLYYLSYSTGTTHRIVYATSEDPSGPFTFRGTLLEPVTGWTTHHSIVEIGGRWYLFYHDCELSHGINHRRCVKYTELFYDKDGSIRTISPYEGEESQLKSRIEWLDDYLLNKRGVTKDHQDDWNWTRYYVGGKMFAAFCFDDIDRPVYITLKLDPEEGDYWRRQYNDIIPGYYMNKQHWNSVKVGGKVPYQIAVDLLDSAYDTVMSGFSLKKQMEIAGKITIREPKLKWRKTL